MITSSLAIVPLLTSIQLDLDSLDGARLDFDPVGHYAREELLKGLLLRKD